MSDLAMPVGRFSRRFARLSRPVTFWAIAAVLGLYLAASAAPSPLYVVYQQEWGFSATVLTLVFAVYVLGLLGSLLVLGALSDHVGRRPVIAASIALEAVALVLFIVAGDVVVLAAARLAQGVATGAAVTSLGATLVDLNPDYAPGRAGVVNGVTPISGLAIGALGCGALVQFGPWPTHMIYAILLLGMCGAAAVVALMPETSPRRRGARESLKPRVGIPARLRSEILALVPILLASWALGGLYLSLGPSVTADVFDLRSHLVGGLVVTLLCGTGAISAYALRKQPLQHLLALAASLLATGMTLTLVGVEVEVALLAAAGTIVAGVGFGASTLGSFGTVARLAAPQERGALFAVVYVISYLAFSLPAVLAGFASTAAGLRVTAVVYGIVVVFLSLAAAVAQSVLAARGGAAPG